MIGGSISDDLDKKIKELEDQLRLINNKYIVFEKDKILKYKNDLNYKYGIQYQNNSNTTVTGKRSIGKQLIFSCRALDRAINKKSGIPGNNIAKNKIKEILNYLHLKQK